MALSASDRKEIKALFVETLKEYMGEKKAVWVNMSVVLKTYPHITEASLRRLRQNNQDIARPKASGRYEYNLTALKQTA